MQITQTTFAGRNQVFDYIHEDLPGGVSLDTDRFAAGTEELKAGAPLYVDKTARVAYLVKTSTVLTGSATDAVRVAKGSHWIVGDFVSDGVKAEAIVSITTSNAGYDILNFTTGLTNYAAGTVLYQTTSEAMQKGSAATVEGIIGDYLTIWDPTFSSDGLKVVLARNGSDALAVTYASGVLTIALAKDTHTHNTVALIEAAINALITNDFPWEAMFCLGDGWDGAQIGAVLTTASAFMAPVYPDLYIPNGLLKDTVNVEGYNVSCSAVLSGAARLSAMPFPLTTGQKAKLSKFTFNT
jgi:hypothetical protein